MTCVLGTFGVVREVLSEEVTQVEARMTRVPLGLAKTSGSLRIVLLTFLRIQ